MAATPYVSLLASARFHMRAARGNPTDQTYSIDSYWSDAELFNIALRGTTDLHGAVADLHQSHFLTILADGAVTLNAGATQISGIPLDCFRVYLIEPLDAVTNRIRFVPKPYNHPLFIGARQLSAVTQLGPTNNISIFYDVTGVGTPNAAPTILTAPKLATSVPLNFCYVPNLPTAAYELATATNPIPGESDNAIIAWTVAYALGKERQDRAPDATWITFYQTEKANLLTRLTPRQEQEVQVVESVFDW